MKLAFFVFVALATILGAAPENQGSFSLEIKDRAQSELALRWTRTMTPTITQTPASGGTSTMTPTMTRTVTTTPTP